MSARELLAYWYENVWAEDIDYRAIEGASRLSIVLTVRDGKVVRGREYGSREEALRAAGLSGE
jgi:hypothetical protein